MKQHIVLILIAALLALAVAGCSTVTPTPAGSQPAPTEAASQATPAPASEAGQTVPVPPADGSRPLAQIPPAERNDRFSGPAPMSIEPGKTYVATIVTPKGNIVAELYSDTPQSANNFVTLAQNGFYDDLTFHRVEPGFVIQGGDPKGDGTGNPGYTIPAEIGHNHTKGALAWARTSDEVNPERQSSGSQFYVTLNETPFLDGAYTVFGQVIEGMDVAEQIAVGDKIQRIDISTAEASRLPTPTPTPVPNAPSSEEGRPLASMAVDQRGKVYNTAPVTSVDSSGSTSYQATIKTPKGDVVIDLDAKTAPATVGNFILLANLGFYDGMPIAYLQPDSYAVFGSPDSQPDSDIGYTLELEPAGVEATASPMITGTVSMYPVADQNTGTVKASGSQFFISFVASEDAGTPLSTFGSVRSGMDILKELQAGDLIESITIREN